MLEIDLKNIILKKYQDFLNIFIKKKLEYTIILFKI